MGDELSYWLALLHAPGVGAITLQKLAAAFPQLSDLFSAPRQTLLEQGISVPLTNYLQKPDWPAVEVDLAWAAQPLNQIITLENPAYPRLLREIPGAPAVLFVRGNLASLSTPQIAMVGSRNPTPIGIETAYEFASHFSQSGLTITSGLALGIDAASHKGVLSCKGKTLAIMGTGLDKIYPLRHRDLADQILAAGGALVSEFFPGTLAKAENFPRRNRLISGLSLGVLVIEAAVQSGSLITARYALEQGREVFAIPGSIHNPLTRGCHALIKQGAKLVETAKDVLEELGSLLQVNKILPKSSKLLPHGLESLDSKHAKLVECMGFEATAIDTLIARSGFPAEIIASMLLMLELAGYVKAVPGGYIRVPVSTKVIE